jgi:predicted membrane protein
MILRFLGSVERKEQTWDVRLASPVITVAGNTMLDFRPATLGEGDNEIVVLALLGSVEIIVPDHVPVHVSGLSFLGSREILGQSSSGLLHGSDNASPDFFTATGRRLRLSIFTALGSVEVRRVPVASPVTPAPVAL